MLRIFVATLFFASVLTACNGTSMQLATYAPDSIPTPSAAGLAVLKAAPTVSPTSSAASVDAAAALLDSLTTDQRAAAVHPFNSDLRSNWSNLPTGILGFDRNGVRVGDLNTEATALLHGFLRESLSQHGYNTAAGIVGADGILSQSRNAGRFEWSEDNYWIAFFGEPSDTTPWGWQFGGHHLAVNITVDVGRSYLSPTLIATEPASYESGGDTVAALAPQLEAGLALINGLDPATRSAAEVRRRPDELYTGAGEDGKIPRIEGSPVAGWTAGQQQLVMHLVSQWVNLLPDASAQVRLAEIAAYLDQTHFAWRGKTDGSGSLYFRVQGPTLIIEFSTQGNVGADGGHYHSIYRDPTNEYGTAATN